MEVVMNWFTHQPVVLQALLAGLFTWFCTIVGSAVVFFFRTVSRRLLDIMLGFAAGVMIAASFWSLLGPSIGYAEQQFMAILHGFLRQLDLQQVESFTFG